MKYIGPNRRSITASEVAVWGALALAALSFLFSITFATITTAINQDVQRNSGRIAADQVEDRRIVRTTREAVRRASRTSRRGEQAICAIRRFALRRAVVAAAGPDQDSARALRELAAEMRATGVRCRR